MIILDVLASQSSGKSYFEIIVVLVLVLEMVLMSWRAHEVLRYQLEVEPLSLQQLRRVLL